jgi:hypothetical protein
MGEVVAPNTEPPICRFCLDDTVTVNNPFIHPCVCKGSVENVHLRCLLRWIYQRGIGRALNDECNMCKTLYVYEICQLEESATKINKIVYTLVATPVSGLWFIVAACGADYIPLQTQLLVAQSLIATYYGLTIMLQIKNKGQYIYYYFKHWPLHLLALVAVFIVFARNDSGSVLLIYNYLAGLIWNLSGLVDTNIRMRINKQIMTQLLDDQIGG